MDHVLRCDKLSVAGNEPDQLDYSSKFDSIINPLNLVYEPNAYSSAVCVCVIKNKNKLRNIWVP